MQCRWLSGGCLGTTDKDCNPSFLWGDKDVKSVYFQNYLHNGIFNQHSYGAAYAFSVRCLRLTGTVAEPLFTLGFGALYFLQCAIDTRPGLLPALWL